MADRTINQAPINGFQVSAQALSGASTGIKASYQVPAGRSAILKFAAITDLTGGAPTLVIDVSIASNAYTLSSGTVNAQLTPYVTLNAGDLVRVRVTAAIAATTFNVLLCGDEFLTA